MFYEFPLLGFSVFDLKPGSKKFNEVVNEMNLNANYLELLEVIMGMFKYTGLPWRKEFLEGLLLRYGWAAIGKDDNGFHVGWIAYNDKDENGIPIGEADLTTIYGYQMTGEIDRDIVLGFNNDMRLPELKLEMYASMFAETDKSIKCILEKARLNPIPLARDSKVKSALDEAMTDIRNGYTRAVGYDAIRDDFANNGDPVQMLQLTDPEHTDKLQYMSKFYDDVLRRFATFYGHPLASASKMAQVSNQELEGYKTYTRIYPYILKDARLDLINRANDILGLCATVEFSDAWAHLNNEVILQNEEGGTDNAAEGNADTNESTDSTENTDSNE